MKTNYLLKVDIKSESGQLLRASDFHFKTRKEAIKNTVKIVWLISGTHSSQYQVFSDQIFICKDGSVLDIKLSTYKV
jgi:hypothetical protein